MVAASMPALYPVTQCTESPVSNELLAQDSGQKFISQQCRASNVGPREEVLATQIRAARGQGCSLPPKERHILEQALSVDLSCVRIHTDAEADKLTSSLNALAFTSGVDIFFRSGMYDPTSLQGLHLLAHEVTHVAQQASGLVVGRSSVGCTILYEREDPFEQAAEANAARITENLAQLSNTTARRAIKSGASLQTPIITTDQPILIQCAIGLEIEVPVPIDQLSPPDINYIRNEVANEMVAAAAANVAAQNQHKLNARNRVNANGIVPYNVIRAPAGGFRIDGDHDDRVMAQMPAGAFMVPEWPVAEGGRDSIMELVVDPPVDNVAAFNAAMANISNFVTQINNQTQNLSTRWMNAILTPGGQNVSIGPMDYTVLGIAPRSRPAYHNFQGSIQVNIGIDLREYHSLLHWYADSTYAQASNAPVAEQAMYSQIKGDIRLSIDTGRTIAQNIYNAMNGAQRQNAGNLRGLRGWITHLSLYLRRGTIPAGVLAGSAKNVVPILVKSPNSILTHYGMTPAEQNHFTLNRNNIMDQIFQATGRGADMGQPLNTIRVFAALPNRPNGTFFNADELSNVNRAIVELAGTPILNPVGVGPIRTGNVAVQGLPTVGLPAQRGGLVVEFRAFPGYYDGPASWRALGLDFFAQATTRNGRNGIEP